MNEICASAELTEKESSGRMKEKKTRPTRNEHRFRCFTNFPCSILFGKKNDFEKKTEVSCNSSGKNSAIGLVFPKVNNTFPCGHFSSKNTF